MKRFALSLALVTFSAGLIAAGCGTDTTGQTTTGTPAQTVPLEKASTEMAKVFCGIVFSCCDATEMMAVLGDFTPAPTTQAECESTVLQPIEEEIFAGLKAGVAAGRLDYDAAKAASCFAKADGQCNLYKEDIFSKQPECANVFIAKVADGGDCAQSNECAVSTSTCIGASDVALGKCTPPTTEGQPCPDYNCAAGLVCSSDAMPVCIKPNADGVACVTDSECTSGYCDFMTAKCTAKKANGEACDSPSACKDGWCDVNAKLCKAKKALGEACMSYEECVSDECSSKSNTCGGPFCDGK